MLNVERNCEQDNQIERPNAIEDTDHQASIRAHHLDQIKFAPSKPTSDSNLKFIYYLAVLIGTLATVQLILVSTAIKFPNDDTSQETRYGKHLRTNYVPGEQVDARHAYHYLQPTGLASRNKRSLTKNDIEPSSADRSELGQSQAESETGETSLTPEINLALPLDQVIPIERLEGLPNGNDEDASDQNGAQSSLGQEATQFDSETPSLAEITAMGTAVGLMANNHLAAINRRNDFEPQTGNERPTENEPHIAQRQHADSEQQQTADVPQVSPADSADQMPDSIESLMGTDLDDAPDADASVDQGPEPQQGQQGFDSSWPGQQVGIQKSPGLAYNPNENDEDDESSYQKSGEVLRIPQSLSQDATTSDYGGNAPRSNIALRSANSLAQGPEAIDLNTAAGHHYGKKKKKKKVIIVKKKKKKKVKKKKKKIVIVKKKKKKVYKKKKKGKAPKKKHHHDHGKYYMYAKVPKKKSWEFGFKKGNKKHWIERHEKGHKNKFKTKVKWYDKKSKGKGVHIWDYNHHDKKKKKHYG